VARVTLVMVDEVGVGGVGLWKSTRILGGFTCDMFGVWGDDHAMDEKTCG